MTPPSAFHVVWCPWSGSGAARSSALAALLLAAACGGRTLEAEPAVAGGGGALGGDGGPSAGGTGTGGAAPELSSGGSPGGGAPISGGSSGGDSLSGGGGSFGGGTSGGGAAGGTTPVGAGGEVASSDGGAPAACVLTYSSLAPRHCYSELDCPEGPTRVRCNGSSPASCECHVADVRTDFVVNGPAADPCALVARSCVETPADDLPPPLCEPFEAEAYADSCWVDSRCTRAVALDGGVTLARVSSHDRASCDLVEGRWECRCELPTGDVELDLPDAASSTAICDEAIRRCFHDELTVVAGRTCMSDFVEASDAACQTWVNCTTSLSAGGIDAELVQWSLLQCSLEDGVLDCLCEASYAHGPMTVPGGDPWSDCPALAERCIADLLPLP